MDVLKKHFRELAAGIIVWGSVTGLIAGIFMDLGLKGFASAVTYFVFITVVLTGIHLIDALKERPIDFWWYWFLLPILGLIGGLGGIAWL